MMLALATLVLSCTGPDQPGAGGYDPCVPAFWYTDQDGDGYGVASDFLYLCDQPAGTASLKGDCDDADAAVYPGAADVWYDGVDSDCGGEDDFDADGDGFASDAYAGDDCDDAEPSTNPGVGDVCGDGIDNNCDGLPPTCGLSGTNTEADADFTVLNTEVGDFASNLAYAGDSNGDGIGELLFDSYPRDPLKGAPLLTYVLIQLPDGLHQAKPGTAAPRSELELASFSLSDPTDTWDWTEVGHGAPGSPPYIANVDLDHDGYPDYLLSSRRWSNGPAHDRQYRIDVVFGPAQGAMDLDDATWTVQISDHAEGIGAAMVMMDQGTGLDWTAAARSSLPTADLGTRPQVHLLGPQLFDGSGTTLDDMPAIYSTDAYETGRNPDSADVDGDGVADLLVGTRDIRNSWLGHASQEVFLGPIVGDVDVRDADLVIDQTPWMTAVDVGLSAGYHHILLAAPSSTGSGARIAVALPLEDCDEGTACGKVFLFDWSGPGWVTPDDAQAVLVGPPEADAGTNTLAWGGDADANGTPELLVTTSGVQWESESTADGFGGLYVVEPPVSGTYALDDSEITVRRDLVPSYGFAAAVMGDHSVDGDAWDDLIVTDPSLVTDPTKKHDDRDYQGGFYVFRGGPTGF